MNRFLQTYPTPPGSIISADRANPPCQRRQTPRRVAMVIVIMLVGLALVTALLGVAVRSIDTQRQRWRFQAEQTQLDWLVRSAAERARMQLTRDAGYRGETWEPTIPPEEAGYRARVEIAVQAQDADAWTIGVEASLRRGQRIAARRQAEFTATRETVREASP